MKHKHLIAVIASGLTVVASCTSNSKASAKEEGCGQATEQTDARAEETFVTEDIIGRRRGGGQHPATDMPSPLRIT